MSETPRTDAELKLEAFMDGFGIVETIQVEFARQLEAELADKEKQLAESRAEIENLKWHINNEKAKAEAALELNGKALELVNEARADAERWKSEHEDSLRRAKDNAVSLSGTVTEYAGELFAKDKQLAEARAEIEALKRANVALNEEIKIQRTYVTGRDSTIERKDKLIEQMRGALTKLIGTLEVMSVMPETLGKCPVLAIDAPELEQARAALVAERGE